MYNYHYHHTMIERHSSTISSVLNNYLFIKKKEERIVRNESEFK